MPTAFRPCSLIVLAVALMTAPPVRAQCLDDGAGLPAAKRGDAILVSNGQLLSLGNSVGLGVGDLDGDGDLDAYVAFAEDAIVERSGDHVCLNDGTGQFLGDGVVISPRITASVALGDIDGNGTLDVAVGDGSNGGVVMLLNDGQAHFNVNGQRLGLGTASHVALGDLDGDGDLDLFVAQGFSAVTGNEVWYNDGTGQFFDSGQHLGSAFSSAVALGDLDGDGDLDAFVANGDGFSQQADAVWLNDGFGRFVDSGQALGSDHSSLDVALGDVDGDGDLDAVTAVDGVTQVEGSRLWLNDGLGVFVDSGQRLIHDGITAAHAAALSDLDGDGHLDLYLGTNGPDAVWLNDGQGVFVDSGQRLGSDLTNDAAASDFDGDGDPDVFTAQNGHNIVWINQDLVEIVVDDVTVSEAEPGGQARFTVALTKSSTQEVSVIYSTADVTAEAGLDYLAVQDTLVFPPGETELTIAVDLIDDEVPEREELFAITLSEPVNAVLLDGDGVGTIQDDDDVLLQVDDVVVAEEEGEALFRVVLSHPAPEPVTVSYGTADGSAQSGSDYVGTADVLILPTEADTAYIAVSLLGDALHEGNEVFLLQISEAEGAVLSNDTATAILLDDDPPPTISVGDTTAAEPAGAVVFTLSLSEVSGLEALVSYTTRPGTALAGDDYVALSSIARIAPGETTTTISIPLTDDLLPESDEVFYLDISAPVNAVLGTVTGVATLTDDDAPTLTLRDAAVDEHAGTASFTVALSGATLDDVSVDYSTADGTAVAGADYVATTGTLTITEGDTTAVIEVLILDDLLNEADEAFSVTLNNPVRATLADATGTGTIIDNDPLPSVTITNGAAAEEAGLMSFIIQLSAESGQEVTLEYFSVDGTAIGGLDYQPVEALLTLPPGVRSDTLRIVLLDDLLPEGNETFFIQLRNPQNAILADAQGDGLILDNDLVLMSGLTVDDVNVLEDAGAAVFTVARSAPTDGTVSVSYATADSTATQGLDYDATSGILTFGPGVLTQTIAVAITDDQAAEGTEFYRFHLFDAVDAIIEDSVGIGTIIDNDMPGIVLTETDGGTAVAEGGLPDTYTIQLSTIPAAPVTITATADDPALDLGAGAGVPLTLIFATDASALDLRTITLTVADDAQAAGPKQATITHAVATDDPDYSEIDVAPVVVQITDDDPRLSVTPDQVDYGEVVAGTTAEATVLIANTGYGDLTLTDITFSGAQADAFSVVTGAPPGVVAPEATRAVVIAFAPTSAGAFATTMQLHTDAGNAQLALTGEGVGAALALSADVLDFGSLLVGRTEVRSVTVTNTGTAPLDVAAFAFTGTDAAAFAVQGTPPTGLINPAEQRTLTLVFAPVQPGTASADLVLTTNVGTATVALTGSGIAPTITVVTPPGVPPVAQSYTVIAATEPDFKPTLRRIFFRPGGVRVFVQTDMTATTEPSTFQGEVPGPFVTERGFEYYVLLSDGLTTITHPAVDPENNPIHVQVALSPRTAPTVLAPAVYSMVSVPLLLDDPSVAGVLEDDLGPAEVTSWRLLQWRSSADAYVAYPNDTTLFRPGQAFWLITEGGGTFDVGQGQSVDTAVPYALTLAPGWNQIGNPFSFPVAWSAVEGLGREAVGAPVHYDGAAYQYQRSELAPWTGYFVFNNAETPVTLLVPPVDARAAEAAGKGAGLDSADALAQSRYVLQLTAEAPRRQLRDGQNWLALHDRAQAGPDTLDFPEAPGVGDHVRLSIMEAGRRLAASFRPPTDGQHWDLEVEAVYQDLLGLPRPVRVTLSEAGQRPEGYGLHVLDLDRAAPVPLDGAAFDLTLTSAAPVRRLRIIVGPAAYAESHRDGIPLTPLADRLAPNYPNPFNPETQIAYQISARSRVVLGIYNMLGQRIRTLVDADQPTGRYQVAWDGRNDAGHRVSSGVYVYRLQTETFNASRTMLLLR